MRAHVLALGLLALLLSGCLRPAPLEALDSVEITPLRTISTIEARVLLALTGVKGIPVAHDVDCYRVIYTAADARRRPMRLSGLLALPRGVEGARRLASFQHGTTTTRTAVPSNLDGTGIAAAIVFAGNGYAVVAPDYPGLGVSEGPHPYYIADAIAPSIVGLIDTAQALDAVSEQPPFLTGFSEGGWASLAALRLMESQGREVLGAALVAGAYDLRNISVPAALQGGASQHALYLAYLAWGQAAYFGEPLESVLTPTQSANVARLFNGAEPKEIVEGLPANPRDLFNEEALRALEDEGAHWLAESLAENGLTEVIPRAPVRLYYGSEDRDVLPAEAIEAERRMRAAGADARAVNVGAVGHDASMLAAAPLMFAWLRERDTAP